MHDITNIFQHKLDDSKLTLFNYLDAVIFAICIGVPFAIYFWRM